MRIKINNKQRGVNDRTDCRGGGDFRDLIDVVQGGTSDTHQQVSGKQGALRGAGPGAPLLLHRPGS